MSLVLAVDDDADIRVLVETVLEREGHLVVTYAEGEALIADLQNRLPDVIVLDILLPGMDGLAVLREVRRRLPAVPVLMLTAATAIDKVVEAMRLGAYDYLGKPIAPTELTTSIRNATERHALTARLSRLERDAEGRGLPGVVGQSRPMVEVYDEVDRVAPSEVSVLVRGESGTGKELVSQAVHQASARGEGPFVAVNCAAIPAQLQESELFGHERGAFTGASARRVGRFEEADGGTLFLDEIGDLSIEAQAKVLRAIQERRFRRLGGSRDLESDFRLVSATHRDLDAMIQNGEFREDLFFRLAVFEIHVPPLRRRREDIPLLIQHFIEQHARHEAPPSVSTSAMAALLAYPWPGNVRELQNAVLRALVTCRGEIRIEDLPERVREGDAAPSPDDPAPHLRLMPDGDDRSGASPPSDARDVRSPAEAEILPLDEVERIAITRALEITHGNISEAARRLEVGRTTLYRKLDEYGLR
ncbi:MAG: sigma-54 dependent transcriptional regulator [Longimicrobiales bacterium]|nr:sigma-54 dependent transcriptional regulator [Longimicrobiales bacterium]